MDPLTGINTYTPLIGIGNNGTVNPTAALLASELSASSGGLFGSSSTMVDLSALSQLLSATTTFQDRLQALQPGTATSGGGQNFGTDFASLAAEAQYFVDTFNGLQNSISNISTTNGLLGGDVSNATAFIQSLNTQAQASYTNGNSALTSLSQLGIEFQPSPVPGAGGSLSVNLATLQSAFNSDAAGAFSLLSDAASAFNDVAASFTSQTGTQSSLLATLAQNTSIFGFLDTGLLSPAQTNNTELASLLTLGSIGGGANLQQVISALTEYNMVSGLLA